MSRRPCHTTPAMPCHARPAPGRRRNVARSHSFPAASLAPPPSTPPPGPGSRSAPAVPSRTADRTSRTPPPPRRSARTARRGSLAAARPPSLLASRMRHGRHVRVRHHRRWPAAGAALGGGGVGGGGAYGEGGTAAGADEAVELLMFNNRWPIRSYCPVPGRAGPGQARPVCAALCSQQRRRPVSTISTHHAI